MRGIAAAAALTLAAVTVVMATPYREQSRAAAQSALDGSPVSQCDAVASGGSCALGPAADNTPYVWAVPAGLTAVTAIVRGASGTTGDFTGTPGAGGLVIAEIPVTAGQELTLYVATQGDSRAGGWGWASGGDGGSVAHVVAHDGGGGGGASAIVDGQGTGDPVLVGSGGGGGGAVDTLDGGAGGAAGHTGASGQDGQSVNAEGQIVNNGGPGGCGGCLSAGDGGAGGSANVVDAGGNGGGGGGGWAAGDGGGPGGMSKGVSDGGGGGGGGTNRVRADAQERYDGSGTIAAGEIVLMPAGTDAATLGCPPGGNQSEPVWQGYTPPVGTTRVFTVAIGGNGGHGSNDNTPAHGAVVAGTVDVNAGETFQVAVGCSGDHSRNGYGHGGDNGGADGEGRDGGGGGGGTAIVGGDGGLILAAGGGGGAGGHLAGNEGGDGGDAGQGFGSAGAGAGRDGVGGSGGCGGCETDNGQRKITGGHGSHNDLGGSGGGGGGGYQGGAGGGGDGSLSGGGGGAGSSYASTTRMPDALVGTSGTYHSAGGDHDDGIVFLIPVDVGAALTITKQVTEPAEGWDYPTGPFLIDTTCTKGGTEVFAASRWFFADQPVTYEDLPVGAACTVHEPQNGDGDATIPAPDQVVTLAAGANSVVMTNGFDFATLTVTVDVDGPTTWVRPIEVDAVCTFDGQPITLPAPHQSGRLEFDPLGATVQVEGIPQRASCWLQQVTGMATEVVYQATDPGYGPSPDAPRALALGANPQLTITNTWVTADLSVGKLVGGNDPEPRPSDTQYPIEVVCHLGGFAGPVVEDAFSLEEDESHEVTDIPVGATCETTEIDAHGATSTTYSPSRNVTVMESGGAVSVTNDFDVGSLALTKTVSGPGAGFANHGYVVSVTCGLDGTPNWDEDYEVPAAGGKVLVEDIPSDSVCMVSETENGGATETTYTTTNDPTGSADPGSATVTITDGTTVGVGIDNRFDAAPLQVDAVTTGNGTQFASTQEVVVSCTFNDLPILDTVFAFSPNGGTQQVASLPVGAICDADETVTGGATSVLVDASNAINPVFAGTGAQVGIAPLADGAPTTVSFENQFVATTLTVDKVVAGSAAYAANTEFEVLVTCTLDGQPVRTLGPDGTRVFHVPVTGAGVPPVTVPARAECAVTEPGTGGATSVTFDPSSGDVSIPTDGTPVTVTVTNTFTGADLTLGKQLAGNDAAAHTAWEFPIETACSFNGRQLVPAGNQPTFVALAGGQQVTIANLPVGAICPVAEPDAGGATSVTYSASDPNAVITPFSATVTVLDGPNTVTITNTFDVGTAVVTVELTGPGASTYGEGKTFAGHARCSRQVDSWWVNTRISGDGRLTLPPPDYSASIGDVPAGLRCSVVETETELATNVEVSDPGIVPAGGTLELQIVNEWQLGAVDVHKTVNGPNPGAAFAFATTCTADGDSGPVSIPLAGHADPSFTLTAGGEHTMAALSGAACTIEETDNGGAATTTYVVGTGPPTATGAVVTIGTGSTETVGVQNAFSPGPSPPAPPVAGLLASTGAQLIALVLLAVALLATGLTVDGMAKKRRRSPARL